MIHVWKNSSTLSWERSRSTARLCLLTTRKPATQWDSRLEPEAPYKPSHQTRVVSTRLVCGCRWREKPPSTAFDFPSAQCNHDRFDFDFGLFRPAAPHATTCTTWDTEWAEPGPWRAGEPVPYQGLPCGERGTLLMRAPLATSPTVRHSRGMYIKGVNKTRELSLSISCYPGIFFFVWFGLSRNSRQWGGSSLRIIDLAIGRNMGRIETIPPRSSSDNTDFKRRTCSQVYMPRFPRLPFSATTMTTVACQCKPSSVHCK
jgi:hypothetical protein